MDEPAPIAFANTRSSERRDRIATIAEWRAWVDALPGLAAAGRRIDADGLTALRCLRDDVQRVLRSAATGEPPDEAATAKIAGMARSEASSNLRWKAGRPMLSVPPHADLTVAVAHHLARMTLDLLLAGPPLACCRGHDCLKLFVATRPDRRWCDSTVCGNRARVRAHGLRHAG
jgi:predicted RNA-binding Zn ribbon-like protein